MKTAGDFRQSLGGADAAFEQLVRHTLTKLECEEVKPVKRKISMGFALAAVLALLTVTALAAGSWGIVNYIQGKGQEPPLFKLVTQVPQEQDIARWIDMTIDEVLIDGGKAYLAVTVLPKEENTLIMPKVMVLSEPGGMAVMNNPAYDANMSVQEFADSRGYEKIVGVTPLRGTALAELTSAVYESLDHGGLRCILEYDYEPEERDYPEKRVWFFWETSELEYREDDVTPDHIRISPGNGVTIQAEVMVNISTQTRTSQAADAHDIAGYKGVVEHVTMTPMEDGSVQFTMLVDMNDDDKTEMHLQSAMLLDENGQQVFWLNCRGYNMGISNKWLLECTIPEEHAAIALADRVTIQLQERVWSQRQPRDTYTYTME